MTAAPHTERAHAPFAPSSAKLLIECPGSWQAGQLYDDTSSDAADEGTAAHTLLEWCLTNKAHAKDYPHPTIHVNGQDWEVTGEMVDAVQQCVEHVRTYPGYQMAEVRL